MLSKRFAVAAAAALTLIPLALTGCSNSSAEMPSASGTAKASAYTQCLRDHGIPIEDVQDNGGGAAVGLPAGVTQEDFSRAAAACNDQAAPGAAEHDDSAAAAENVEHLRKVSECVREHGVSDYPDPDSEGNIPDTELSTPRDRVAEIEAACDAQLSSDN